MVVYYIPYHIGCFCHCASWALQKRVLPNQQFQELSVQDATLLSFACAGLRLCLLLLLVGMLVVVVFQLCLIFQMFTTSRMRSSKASSLREPTRSFIGHLPVLVVPSCSLDKGSSAMSMTALQKDKAIAPLIIRELQEFEYEAQGS